MYLTLKTLPGCVGKPHVFSRVRTRSYQYVLPCTEVKFLYCHVLVRTGTYWYVPVRTILPDPVKVYRIPDERRGQRGLSLAMLRLLLLSILIITEEKHWELFC